MPDNASRVESIARAFLAPALLITFLFIVAWAAWRSPGTPSRPEATAELGELAVPSEVYDPVRAGEKLPDGFRQVLARDGILPVYDPRFVSAETAGWTPDALVIGVEIDGEAKAYPVGFLNRREMVIDRLAGIPILVTW